MERMEDSRRKRYRQKLNELEDRLDFLEAHLAWKEEFIGNRVLRKACYKEFQEAVEIVSDLCAMITKDGNRFVEDDYTNLEFASKVVNLNENDANRLKEAHGLRNVVVHEYNGIDDSLAFDSMLEILPSLKEFAKKVKKWLKSV